MIELPESYRQEMKELLHDEYASYEVSFEQSCFHGLRINTNKISVSDFLASFPYPLEPVPWCANGFYYGSVPNLV